MTGKILGGRKAWTVTFLLFIAQTINYFDKNVIGLAAAPLMQELGLTPEQYGLVASSFYSLYALSGVCAGFFLAGRIRSKTLLTILVVIWSLSQLPVIFFASLTMLVFSRVLLGIGEGPANPTAVSACHEWFSNENRNMPTALVTLGSSVGSLVSAPILSYVMAAYGWRSGFLVCSLLGVAWLLIWLIIGEVGPEAAPRGKPVVGSMIAKADGMNAVPLSQKDLWSDPTIIASVIVGFCAYWSVGFVIAWIAPLVRVGLGYDAVTTGWILSAIAGTSSVLMLLISYLSQCLLKRGTSSRLARGIVNSLSMMGGAAAYFAAAMVDPPVIKLVLIAIGGALPVVTFTIGPALISQVVPLAQRSRMIIIIYSIVTIAGLFSPIVAGRLISAGGIGGYDHALMVTALVAFVGGVAGLFLLQPERSMQRFARLTGSTP